MAREYVESNLTPEEWAELGKELSKWATNGPCEKWGTRKSKEPVEVYLERQYGVKNMESFKDVDFKENKLAYHTIQNIRKRQEEENLKIEKFGSLHTACDKLENRARFCPGCDLDRIAYTKKTHEPRYHKLEVLCEKYLRGIGRL